MGVFLLALQLHVLFKVHSLLLLRVLTTFIIFKDWVFVFFIFAPWLGRDAAVVIQGQPSLTPVLLQAVTVRQLSHTLLERTDVLGKGGTAERLRCGRCVGK